MAVDAFELAGKILVDTAGSDKALTETQRQLLKVAEDFKKEEEAAKSAGRGVELSLKQQQAAAESLQRQRSAALNRQWKEEERAAAQHAKEIQRINAQGQVTRDNTTYTALAGQVASATAEIAAFAAPTAIAIGAATGLAAAIYSVASAAAAGSGKIKDLSDQTGFSAETISALANSLESVGGNIDSAAGSLVIFEKNMEDAKDETSEMSETFRKFAIDTDNNEKAIRQAMQAIAELTNKQEQNALAAELFGRAGKQIAGIIRDSGGDLDAIIEKYEQYGTIVGTDAARAGDEFADTQVEVRQQLSASTRAFGEEFYPIVTETLQGFTRLLRENRDEIKWWGAAANAAIRDFANWGPTIATITTAVLVPFATQLALIAATINSIIKLRAMLAGATQGGSLGDFGLPNAPAFRGEGWDSNFGIPDARIGGGGGAKKRTAQDYGIDLLNQLEKQYQGLTNKTELTRISLDLLDDKYKGLSASIRNLIIEKAGLIDSTRKEQELNNKLLSVQESVRSYYRGLLRDIEDLTRGGSTAFSDFERFIEDTNRSLKETGKALDDATVKYGRFLALLKMSMEMRSPGEGFIDNSAASMEMLGINTEWASLKAEALGAAMLSGLGEAPALIEENIEGLQRLSFELANIFTDSFQSLLEEGWSGFFQSILQGFSQLLIQMGTELLASEFFKILTGMAGGGGFFGNLIKTIGGILGGSGGWGGIGGTASTAFGGIRDMGGPMDAGKAYWSGVPEWIVPTQHSQATLPSQLGPTNIYNINAPYPTGPSYVQPISSHEWGNAILSALQRAA